MADSKDIQEEMPDELETTIADDGQAKDQNPVEIDWEEKYRHLASDFSNYRRRVEKQREELAMILEENLLKKLLDLYDDFRRLGNHDAEANQDLIGGLKAVEGKWQKWFLDHEVRAINSVDEEFDPNFHDAVLQESVHEPGLDAKIIRVMEDGYLRKDRVLRHAKVVVGRYEGQREQSHAGGKENSK